MHTQYIGIDWSGRNGRAPGLRVAACAPGAAAPSLVTPQAAGAAQNVRNWRRDEVLSYLNQQATSPGQRVLAGLDFAFSYPYVDVQPNAYFPGHASSPVDRLALWALVDASGGAHFYGGNFLPIGGAFTSYYVTGVGAGATYAPRLRVTDVQAQVASSVFETIGPQAVGIGTLAGMRFLRSVWHNHHRTWRIWPFQGTDDGRSTMVEACPTCLLDLAGVPRQPMTLGVLNACLAGLGSQPYIGPPLAGRNAGDEMDAILIAAALRALDLPAHAPMWAPPLLTVAVCAYEGWILGV